MSGEQRSIKNERNKVNMKRKNLDLGKDGNKATNFWGCHIPLSPPPPLPGADPELLEPPFIEELINFHGNGNVCEKLEMPCFSL